MLEASFIQLINFFPGTINLHSSLLYHVISWKEENLVDKSSVVSLSCQYGGIF